MELGEAEALGVLDDHDRRLGHVDADLDDRGRDEDLRLAALEALHRRVLVGARHPAVHEPDGVAEDRAQGARRALPPPPTSSVSLSSTSGQIQ